MGAVTVGLAVVLVRRALAGREGGGSFAPLLGGLAAGAMLGGCGAFLDQSVITEQYTLLTALGLAVVLAAEEGGFTVGALVQANHGRRERLAIDGVPVGREIGFDEVPSDREEQAESSQGDRHRLLCGDGPTQR